MIQTNIAIGINTGIICILMFGMFGLWAIPYVVVSGIFIIFLPDTAITQLLVHYLVKGGKMLIKQPIDERRKLLVSAAFLSIALKIAGIFGALVVGGSILFMFIIFVLAFGLLFESRPGDFAASFGLAQIVVKVGNFLMTLGDYITKGIIFLECKLMGFELI